MVTWTPLSSRPHIENKLPISIPRGLICTLGGIKNKYYIPPVLQEKALDELMNLFVSRLKNTKDHIDFNYKIETVGDIHCCKCGQYFKEWNRKVKLHHRRVCNTLSMKVETRYYKEYQLTFKF